MLFSQTVGKKLGKWILLTATSSKQAVCILFLTNITETKNVAQNTNFTLIMLSEEVTTPYVRVNVCQ